MPARKRPLVNLRLDGHPACRRTVPITGGPEPVTLDSSAGWVHEPRHESSTRLEIIGLRCAGNRGDFFAAPQIKSLFEGSHLFGVMIVLVRVTLGTVLGVYGYLLLFDGGRHSSTREDQ
jgi:hypothetical protein